MVGGVTTPMHYQRHVCSLECMAQVMMDGRMHGSPSESLSLIHAR